MKIFTVLNEERYELAQPVDGADWETSYLRLAGRPQKSSWTPFEVKVVREEYDGSPFSQSQSPWFGSHALVFRQDAVIKLGDFLTRTGEILPLKCKEDPLFIWQPLAVVDALDVDRSEVWRAKDGRLTYIRRHAFYRERLLGVDAFKIPQLRVSPVFFSERAATILSSAVPVGLEFRLVWNSERKEPNQPPDPTPLRGAGHL